MANENQSGQGQGAPAQGTEESHAAELTAAINESTQQGGSAQEAAQSTQGATTTAGTAATTTAANVATAGQQQQQPLTADIIKGVVEATIRGSQPAQRQEPAKELSTEDFNKKFGIVNVTEAHIAQLLDQDPKKAAFALNQLLQANTAAAVRMAMELNNAELSKVRGEFDPHIKSWQAYQQEQRNTQAENQFFANNADLKDERDLVMTVKDAMIAKVQSGQIKFNTQEEAFQAVATACKQILTRMKGTGAGTAVGTTGATQQVLSTGGQGTRQMSAASAAGRSGSGNAVTKNAAEEIFGADAR